LSSHLALGVDIRHYISVFTMKSGLVRSDTIVKQVPTLTHSNSTPSNVVQDYFLMGITTREAKSQRST